MNKITEFIHKTVYRVAIESNGIDQWMKYGHDIRRRLKQLEPDKPGDGTSGFLAYNVSKDKPRMKIKVGRFFTKKLQLNSGYLNDVAIQKISTIVSMELWPNIRTELVKGSDITKAYENEIGTTSCMTGDYAKYTRLYESNPDRFQMLIMHYSNNSARAIVHKLDNGKYFMDRVYADCEDLKIMMTNYAIDHNWYYGYNIIYFNGTKIDDYDDIIVSGLNYDDGEVPFMDTLTEYRLRGSKIDIFHTSARYSADGTLDSTNGYLDNSYTCENCSESMPEDDMICVDDITLCRDCYDNDYFYCESCSNSHNNDDSVLINGDIYVCQHCAYTFYSQCVDCEEYFTNDEVYSTSYDDIVCESCLEKYSRCENCNEYFTSDDIIGDYCEDCQPEDDDPISVQNENDTVKLPFEEGIQNVE